MLGGMDMRRKFIIALWAAFGLFWAILAGLATMEPNVEPWSEFRVLYIAMVAWCAFIGVRVARGHRAKGS